MTLRAFTLAVAVSAGAALLLPGTAEARHRHGRHCDHGHYDRSPRYSRSYDYRHDYRYSPYYRHDRYYDDYDRYDRHYRRGYRYYPRVYDHYPRYYAPRGYVHYHGRARCSRVHVGFHFGW